MLSWLARRADSELVVVASLDRSYDAPLCRKPLSGLITDLGFAAGPGQPIAFRQPREREADNSVLYDRLSIQQEGDLGGNGRVELREQLAYDLHHRSEIPWTGIHVSLHMTAETMGRYISYLGSLALPSDSFSEWREVIFRFPTRKFDFPIRRGGFDLKADTARIGKLREIRKFKIDRLTVQKLENADGKRIKAVDGLPAESGDVSPVLLIFS